MTASGGSARLSPAASIAIRRRCCCRSRISVRSLWSISAIARHVGRDRRTVRAYLDGKRQVGVRALAGDDAFARYLTYCTARLREDPHLWATALFDEVTALGYDRSYPSFTRALRLRGVRPVCEPCHPAKGRPVAVIDQTWHIWWLLPILGIFVGWTTNLLGMWLIFDPPEARRILGIKVQGLFLRRQAECAEVYAGIIADDVITLERIA